MTTHTDKTDSWRKPNSDKFDFNEHARNMERADEFSQLDRRGLGLRDWIEGQTRAQAASSGTNTTLIPGKLYLRQQPSGLWELSHNRGRGVFDCYVSESREEMLQLAEEIQNQSGR